MSEEEECGEDVEFDSSDCEEGEDLEFDSSGHSDADFDEYASEEISETPTPIHDVSTSFTPMEDKNPTFVERGPLFEVIHESQLYSAIRKEIKELKKILYIDFYTSKEILSSFQWNREKVLLEFAESGREGIFSKVGLDCHLNIGSGSGEMECPICFDDVPLKKSVTISKCSHSLCRNCLIQYFKVVESERIFGTKKRISCPMKGCKSSFHANIVFHILKTKKSEIKKDLVRNYVVQNKYVTFCPHKRCGNYVSKLKNTDSIVMGKSALMIDCQCGKKYCFHCSTEEMHNPASCEHMKRWMANLDQDAASSQWVELNSRPCPKCKVAIVKNGGCNMMHCGQCGVHFCWTCMAGGVSYGHTCVFSTTSPADQRSQEDQKRKLRKNVEKLDRTYYYSSFEKWRGMESSREKEKGSIFVFKEMPDLMKSAKVLIKCRTVMMNCIVYFFYEFNNELYKFETLKEAYEREMRKFPKYDPSRASVSAHHRKKQKKYGAKLRKLEEKMEHVKRVEKKLVTNRNLFTCFLEQLEENTERLSHMLSKKLSKIGKYAHKIKTITSILEELLVTVEKKMHIFEKDRVLEEEMLDMTKEKKKKM